MHIASKLFSLRFVFVVLLIIHSHTAIACIDICDAFATAAITIAAGRTATIEEKKYKNNRLGLRFSSTNKAKKDVDNISTCYCCCYFAVLIANIVDYYWMATIPFGPLNVMRKNYFNIIREMINLN